MSGKHTPGPWTYLTSECTGGRPQIRGTGLTICYPNTSEKDAEFIVRACNAHDDLLAALIQLREWIRAPWAPDDSPANEQVIDETEAAIAKAEGGAL